MAQNTIKLMIGFFEANHHINLQLGAELLGADFGLHNLLEALLKGGDVFYLERESGSMLVAAKLLQEVGTSLDGFVNIKIRH